MCLHTHTQELQRVFAHMHLGRARDYNPKKFAQLLALDRGTQQDPQEFHRLFMNKIEECFGSLPGGRELAGCVAVGKRGWVGWDGAGVKGFTSLLTQDSIDSCVRCHSLRCATTAWSRRCTGASCAT